MGDKTFNLTWNNHLANLSGLFEGLYKSGSLTDTTLACQGGMLRAHKLVLAACSPYFERVFKEHHGEQPILILKGVPVEEMECLLDFMYRGSINVAEEHLPSLIKTATDLEIRGLSGDERSENDNVYSRIEVEARGIRACQIETRLENYAKICDNSTVTDCIKLEEIEVEDDPMIMESHEDDTYEETMQTATTNSKQQIRHVPAPMFKRQIRYDGQKRVSLAHPTSGRDKDENSIKTTLHWDNNFSSRDSNRDDNCDNNPGSTSGHENDVAKSEHLSNNGNFDPTVPAIQMNEDSMVERERDPVELLNSPGSESLDETDPSAVGKKKITTELTKKDSSSGQGAATISDKKERNVAGKRDKSQYKPFPCDLCTLAFTRASHLARHRRVHTGERPFACSLCPRMFARQDKLKQHLDSHLQWPKRKNLASLANLVDSSSSSSVQGHMIQLTSLPLGGATSGNSDRHVSAIKGKRGRPRKVYARTSMTSEHLADSRND